MTDRERSIRERAYEIWQSEGCPEGRNAQHWEQARAELAQIEGETGTTSVTPSSAKTKATGRKAAAKPKSEVEKAAPKLKKRADAKVNDISSIDRDAAVLGKKPSARRKPTDS